MDISLVFNVDDLLPYQGTCEPSTFPSSVFACEASKGAPTMPSLQYSKETVDIIVDDEFVTFRDCGFYFFPCQMAWSSYSDCNTHIPRVLLTTR